jgi:nitric oxide reductase NorD protein
VSDPEGLVVEGARRAAVAARERWRSARPREARPMLSLAHVKRRLELFVAALYDRVPAILPADPPPPPTWLARVLGRAPRHLSVRTALASTDGSCIWLPRQLEGWPSDTAAAATFRLLAAEQVARAVRGTAGWIARDRLEQDLYLLAEAVAVDRELAREFPGLIPDLRSERDRALRERPALERLTAGERIVEGMVRDVLAADPRVPPLPTGPSAEPADSLAWARTAAAGLGTFRRGYRGVASVALWGEVVAGPSTQGSDRHAVGEHRAPRRPLRSASLRRRPRVRRADDAEDDDRPGTWMIRADEPMESVEDPRGLQRPADRDDDAEPADLADSLSELPDARVVRSPGTPREVLDSDAATLARAPARIDSIADPAGIVYPEWDCRLAAYRQRGAVVRPGCAPPGSGAWVADVMARHAALVRRVRRRFDGLRPRRLRVRLQADGADVDLSAYVTAFANWRARAPADDRFYTAARPVRRDLAIALLIDVSASTDSWVSGNLRIIDVEKESLIVLLEALDALGDRHAAFGFSGEGPGAVRVVTIKDFDERGGVDVRRRVAALEPDGYTRAGAAIRHTSALLAREAARHRLLLVLSDGKPNDVDQYAGRYGIEDTRQAVAEARLQGLVPYCLTVDREAPAYMPSIFGPRGYAVLRRQDLLPAVLIEVVRRLLVT